MRSANMTLQAIADQLNAEGVPTLRGGAMWRPSSVQAALGYRRPVPRPRATSSPLWKTGSRTNAPIRYATGCTWKCRKRVFAGIPQLDFDAPRRAAWRFACCTKRAWGRRTPQEAERKRSGAGARRSDEPRSAAASHRAIHGRRRLLRHADSSFRVSRARASTARRGGAVPVGAGGLCWSRLPSRSRPPQPPASPAMRRRRVARGPLSAVAAVCVRCPNAPAGPS